MNINNKKIVKTLQKMSFNLKFNSKNELNDYN